MSWFGRKDKIRQTFWRTPPMLAGADVLYQRGIIAISQQDGRTAMSVGWRIWRIAGMHQFQAYDFLADGYRSWCDQDAPTTRRSVTFCWTCGKP